MRDRREDTETERLFEDGDRDWNDAATGNANTYKKLEKAF